MLYAYWLIDAVNAPWPQIINTVFVLNTEQSRRI